MTSVRFSKKIIHIDNQMAAEARYTARFLDGAKPFSLESIHSIFDPTGKVSLMSKTKSVALEAIRELVKILEKEAVKTRDAESYSLFFAACSNIQEYESQITHLTENYCKILKGQELNHEGIEGAKEALESNKAEAKKLLAEAKRYMRSIYLSFEHLNGKSLPVDISPLGKLTLEQAKDDVSKLRKLQ